VILMRGFSSVVMGRSLGFGWVSDRSSRPVARATAVRSV
jgi:hypothetical protein